MTDIGPGTILFIAPLTACTVWVKSSFSIFIPFSDNASLIYVLLLNGLELYGIVITVRLVHFLSQKGLRNSGIFCLDNSATTL